MCRVLTYYGDPILLDNLLYKPNNSLIKQSYDPKLMTHIQNLAGFGMALWDKNSFSPDTPYLYRTPYLPFFDVNLKDFSLKTRLHCLLAHVRGVGYRETEVVNQQNVHPFLIPGHFITLAHNGNLEKFSQMKFDLLPFIKPDIASAICGTTDSEWIYALILSCIPRVEDENDPKIIAHAILKTFEIIKFIREKHDIKTSSPVNLFITNGHFLIATRFVFNYGCYPQNYEQAHLAYHSLWYTYGKKYGKYDNEYRMSEGDKKCSVIISSEPLTIDMTSWIEVPEYSLMIAEMEQDEIAIKILDIDI